MLTVTGLVGSHGEVVGVEKGQLLSSAALTGGLRLLHQQAPLPSLSLLLPSGDIFHFKVMLCD